LQYYLGLEDIEPRHWIAWVFDLPGCFSTAVTPDDAVDQAPSAISAYHDYVTARDHPRLDNGDGDGDGDIIVASVAETFHSYVSEGDYIVNAFFADDQRPVTSSEVTEVLWLLDQSRRDLLSVVVPLSAEQRGRVLAGEARGSIDGILDHIAVAEWWYWSRIGRAPVRENLSSDSLHKAEQIRAWTRAHLPSLVADSQVTELMGEQWSARKVLRRILWHERDHINHLVQLVSG